MLKKILLALLGVVVLLVAFIATRPSTFSLSRSGTIHAPAEIVYGEIADFHKWNGWSPWDKMDPDMKRTYSGADAGKGAVYEWVGNDKVGKGKMAITDATAPSRIVIALSFIEPFAAENVTTFDVAAAGDDTKVTWTMTGDMTFFSKAMQLVMPMDDMVGPDFEKGLASMKTVAEADAKAAADAAAKAAADAAAAAAASAAVDPNAPAAPVADAALTKP